MQLGSPYQEQCEELFRLQSEPIRDRTSNCAANMPSSVYHRTSFPDYARCRQQAHGLRSCEGLFRPQSEPIRDRTLGSQRFQQTLFTSLEIFTFASLEGVLRQDESARQGVSPLQLLIERESIIFLFSFTSSGFKSLPSSS